LPQPYPGLATDLDALVSSDFLRATPFEQLVHFPRYLKAMKLRAERAKKNPAKDAERAATLAPYVKRAREIGAGDSFRWLVEEFRVSLFAQELGTAEPVSAVKLDRAWKDVDASASSSAQTTERNRPVPVATLPVAPQAKQAPLKNLGALDKLFRR
jgi:ATP-dependent helicase HrpA